MSQVYPTTAHTQLANNSKHPEQFTPRIPIHDLVEEMLKKLGYPTDIWAHDETVLGYASDTYKHIHNPGNVYPADGTVKTATTSATASEFGAMVEVIPANTIDVAFDIHWLNITDISANGVYVIELHLVDENLVSLGRQTQAIVTRTDNFTKTGEAFCQMTPIPPNSRLGARVLKGVLGEGSVSFAVQWHDYA